jgi:hypothetical protein
MPIIGIPRAGEKLLPLHVDFRRRFDSKSDLSACDPDHSHNDVAVDDHSFVFLAR